MSKRHNVINFQPTNVILKSYFSQTEMYRQTLLNVPMRKGSELCMEHL